MELILQMGEAFLLGLATPLGAVCVLPLYPGFLVYLSSQLSGKKVGRYTIFLFGLTIFSGVILFMLLLGLIFTTIFEVSLTNVIGIVSPIAFGILLIIGLLLILNVDIGRFLPKGHTPPLGGCFLYMVFSLVLSWCRAILASSPCCLPEQCQPQVSWKTYCGFSSSVSASVFLC